MLTKFQNHLDKNFTFLKDKKLFLAVSGGIDSMVLVELLNQLHCEIAVLHCNFSLRGDESDADEEFIKIFCETNKIPFYSQKFDTEKFASDYKLSIQLAARKLRYDWFYEMLASQNYDYLLTAHHLDDNLETFLINLSRGTGLYGLTGIPANNDKIIRPLLPFSREEICAFAVENDIIWREDSSNSANKYLRNKLRHDVIPILKEVQPNLLSSFENTLLNLKQAQTLVHDAARLIYKDVVDEVDGLLKINLKKLMQLSNYQAYLYQWLSPYNFTAWQDIYDLVHGQSGKQVFSETHILLKDRDFLILYRKEYVANYEEFHIHKNQVEVKFPLNIALCQVSDILEVSTNCIFVDETNLHYPLTIRKWKEGDYFYPFGMENKKKLSKFFKDEKFSLVEKSATWLLCSNNEIVWVIGKRMDNRYKVTNNTTHILKISVA